jgi:hypothetical protein
MAPVVLKSDAHLVRNWCLTNKHNRLNYVAMILDECESKVGIVMTDRTRLDLTYIYTYFSFSCPSGGCFTLSGEMI